MLHGLVVYIVDCVWVIWILFVVQLTPAVRQTLAGARTWFVGVSKAKGAANFNFGILVNRLVEVCAFPPCAQQEGAKRGTAPLSLIRREFIPAVTRRGESGCS